MLPSGSQTRDGCSCVTSPTPCVATRFRLSRRCYAADFVIRFDWGGSDALESMQVHLILPGICTSALRVNWMFPCRAFKWSCRTDNCSSRSTVQIQGPALQVSAKFQQVLPAKKKKKLSSPDQMSNVTPKSPKSGRSYGLHWTPKPPWASGHLWSHGHPSRQWRAGGDLWRLRSDLVPWPAGCWKMGDEPTRIWE